MPSLSKHIAALLSATLTITSPAVLSAAPLTGAAATTRTAFETNTVSTQSRERFEARRSQSQDRQPTQIQPGQVQTSPPQSGEVRRSSDNRRFSQREGRQERRFDRRDDRRDDRFQDRRDRRDQRFSERRDQRFDRRRELIEEQRRRERFEERRADARYYRGYRGYHDHRPGYRRHSDGFWYPPAAFVIGAIIGGAIVSDQQHSGVVYSERHHDWCEDRYRSYRRSDATYQPHRGPRQRCDSPYDGL